MRHQKLHLIGQYAAIAQNKVFPQARYVWRVQQRHVSLLGRSAAFAVVAGTAGRDHVHPGVDTFLRKRHDVLTRQAFFVKVLSAISTQIAVTRKELAIGQTWLQIEGVDGRDAFGSDDAVDGDDGLQARQGIVPTVKRCDMRAHFPAHLAGRVMQHGFFKSDPGLRQTLGRELQDLQKRPPSW